MTRFLGALLGVFLCAAPLRAETLIDPATGTHFGDMVELGGVSKMFDGDLVQNNPNFGAYKTGTSAYAGTQWTAPKIFSRALFYGWNDPPQSRGIVDGGAVGTIFIHGKNGPANASGDDGTILGQTDFTEPGGVAYGDPVEVVSNGDQDAYTHIWVRVVVTGFAVAGGELVMYEVEGGVPPPPPPASGRALAIFAGAGQSNMYGNATVPAQSVYLNRDRLQMFALDGAWKPAADPLMDAAGSLWPEFSTGVPQMGPLMPFGDTMAPLLRNFDVGLVNSSQGSTAIEAWAKGQPLYEAMIVRTQAALARAPPGSFIAGVLWSQAESNAFTELTALAWPDQFAALVANIRADLGLPDLPVVVIGLGPEPGGALSAWPMLRGIQRFMALPVMTIHIFTADLPNSPTDADWHTTQSVITIGDRAANAMRPMLPYML